MPRKAAQSAGYSKNTSGQTFQPLAGSALKRLSAWYQAHKRSLPWRNDRDPYKIWVSEIMLQQTQVETVRPYFERFIHRFPTASALAAAEEQTVLKLWEGLGYYRRARNMHAAAKRIRDEHGGKFPQLLADAMKLPGIGRYTAGAVLSIACGERTPILEANTIRLHARLLAFAGDIQSAAGQKILWRNALDILPEGDCGWVNQALMEVGSLVCKPRDPLCEECPLTGRCAAYQQGLVGEIPAAKRKIQFESRLEAVVVVLKKQRVLLRQIPPGERWAGLWDFVRFSAPQEEPLTDSAIHKLAEKCTGLRLGPIEQLPTIRHGVTRYRIELQCRWCEVEGAKRGRGPVNHGKAAGIRASVGWKWHSIQDLEAIPLSATGRKIALKIAGLRGPNE